MYAEADASKDENLKLRLGQAYDILRDSDKRAEFDLHVFNPPGGRFFCQQACDLLEGRKQERPERCVVCGEIADLCCRNERCQEWVNATRQHTDENDYQSALAYLKKLPPETRNDSHVVHDIALLGWHVAADLIQMCQFDQAVTLLLDSLSARPSDIELMQNLAILCEVMGDIEAAAYRWSGYVDALHEQLKYGESLNEHRARIMAARLHLANLAFWNPIHSVCVSETLKRTSEHAQGDAAIIMGLLAENRNKDALNIIAGGLASIDPGVSLFFEGVSHVQSGDSVKGLKLWQAMLKRYPRDGALRTDYIRYTYLIVDDMRRSGDCENAKKLLSALAKYVRNEPRVHLEMAITMKQSGDIDGYIRHMNIMNHLEEQKRRRLGNQDGAQ